MFYRPKTIQNHYTKRRNISAPYSSKVVKSKRPEGHSSDYVGHGTLTHWRKPIKATKPVLSPGVPSGLINQNLNDGIKITWVKSVDPVTSIDAKSYQMSRSAKAGGPYQLIAKNISSTEEVGTRLELADFWILLARCGGIN